MAGWAGRGKATQAWTEEEMMLLPGTYRARAIDWGLGTTASKGTPYTWVKLAVGNEEIDWQGWLSDRSVERTFADGRPVIGAG